MHTEYQLFVPGTWDTIRYLLNKYPVRISREVLRKKFLYRSGIVYLKFCAEIWKSQFDDVYDLCRWLKTPTIIAKAKYYISEVDDVCGDDVHAFMKKL